MKCPSSPKGVAKLMLRIGFGGALVLVGVAHYMNLSGFMGMTSSDLGALEPVGKLWAYVLPALQIVGGALIVAGQKHVVAAWCAGIALASIIIGMLLKTVLGGVPLPDMMAFVNSTFLWLLVYFMVVKCCMCCGSCDSSGGQQGGGHA